MQRFGYRERPVFKKINWFFSGFRFTNHEPGLPNGPGLSLSQMNIIDQIEVRKETNNITTKEICDSAQISIASYSRYKDKSVEPSLSTAIKMLKAVRLKMVTMDEDMTTTKKNPEWGMLSLFVDANNTKCQNIFKENSGIFFVPDSFYFLVLKMALLMVWFHKTNQKTAKNMFLSDVIIAEWSIEELLLQCQNWGLMNINNSPTTKAYEYYENVVIDMKDFLSESNVVCKIT